MQGQLGTGGILGSPTPQPVAELEGVAVGVTAGAAHTCVWRDDGRAFCWGANTEGQLGEGGRQMQLEPVPVDGPEDLVELVAGPRHTCARDGSGQIFCWGAGDQGQLGSDAPEGDPFPRLVEGVPAARGLGPGPTAQTRCFVDLEGTVHCWGVNGSHQLARGHRDPLAGPYAIEDLTGELDGSRPDQAPRSCKMLLDKTLEAAASGVRFIDPDGPGDGDPFPVWCEQEADDGGWTLVLRGDGTQATFIHSAPFWTTGEPLAPEDPGGAAEHVSPAYSRLPFEELRVGLSVNGGEPHHALVSHRAESMLAEIAPDVHVPFAPGPPLGNDGWTALLGGHLPAAGSHGGGCRYEGFNAEWLRFGVHIRWGVQNGCDCCLASFVGFGSGHPELTIGNFGNDAYGVVRVQHLRDPRQIPSTACRCCPRRALRGLFGSM